MKMYVDEIADNMYTQQERAGAPLSWGNAGEGVRLLLGSDVAKRPANISGVATETKTEWLVAASPGAFSFFCANPINYSSVPCPLVGSHSQPFFDEAFQGRPPTRLTGYTLGYNSTLWTPAGKEVWVNALRGMQPIPANATGDEASLLSIMETGSEPLGVVPFKGIRDRVWVRFFPFFFFFFSLVPSTLRPVLTRFLTPYPTLPFPISRIQWISQASTEARVANFGLRGPVLPLDGTPSRHPQDGTLTKFFAPKALAINNAYCFASVGANSTLNGPSGVVCASEDFDGVFEGDCREHKILDGPAFKYYDFGPLRGGRGGDDVPSFGDSYLACVIKHRDWVSLIQFPEQSGTVNRPGITTGDPLAVVCPIERPQPPYYFSPLYTTVGAIHPVGPECGLAYDNDPTTLSQYSSLYRRDFIYVPGNILSQGYYIPSHLVAIPATSCPVGAGSQAPMDLCVQPNTAQALAGRHNRLSYFFWDQNSFDAGGNQPTIPTATPPLLHRLPALKLSDIQPAAKSRSTESGSCYASWDKDGVVPVLCGSDWTRYLVAKLGSVGTKGKVDTTSWPARGANNQTLTTAIMSVVPIPGSVSFTCRPQWRRADGSYSGTNAPPVMTSMVITQSAGPVYAGEEKLAWASGSADLGINSLLEYYSVLGGYPSNSTLSTGSNRYLPRVVTCSIRAVDPGNDGWPVYAIGSYLAVENANATGGIELRPNFSFPAV